MVSGLTPPSKRDDLNKLNEEIQGLRDGIRFTSPPRNTGSTMGSSVGGGGSTIVPAIRGLFALTPSSDVMSVKLTYTFSSNQADLVSGDEVTSSSNGWKGKFVKTESESTSGTTRTYVAVFTPSDSSNPTFVEGAQNLTKSGFTAAYTLTSVSQKTLVLSTSCCIIETVDSQNPTIQNIDGTVNDGQILFVKPKEGKSLTLETGGNIDISSNVTVADNEFAILQYFEDAGNKYLVISGGSSGSNALNANQTLSNLTSPTAVNQSLIPDGDEVEDLGHTSNVWRRLYAKDIYSTGTIRTEALDNELEFYAGGAKSFAVSRSSSAPFTGVAEVWGAGANFKTMSNTGGAANAEIGGFHFDGYDSAVNRDTFASMTAVSTTVTSGTEDALVKVKVKRAGTTQEMFEVNTMGIRLPTASLATPSANGSIFLSGNDVKVKTGGNVVDLSNIGGSTSFVGFQGDANLDMNGFNIYDSTGHLQINDDIDMNTNQITELDSLHFHKTSGTTPKIDTSADSSVMAFSVNGLEAMKLSEASGDPTLQLIGNPSPELKLRSTDASPSDGQIIGGLYFDGYDSSFSGLVTYGSLKFISADITNGTTDGQFRMTMMKNGSATDVLDFKNTELDPNTNDVYALGTSTNRFVEMFTKYVTDVEQISFSNTISGQFINSNTGGLEYYVPSGDDHEFWVNGSVRAEIGETAMEVTVPLYMNNLNQIKQVVDPTDAQDVATKAYVLANAGGSGATQALDNLSGVSINANLTPNSTTWALGSSSNFWASAYINGSVYLGDTTRYIRAISNDIYLNVGSSGDFKITKNGSTRVEYNGPSDLFECKTDATFEDNVVIEDDLYVWDDVRLGSTNGDQIEVYGDVDFKTNYTDGQYYGSSTVQGKIAIKVNGTTRYLRYYTS